MECKIENKKNRLRQNLLKLDFTDHSRESAQIKILFKINQLIESYQPETIFTFFGFKDEPVIDPAIPDGIKFLYPRIKDYKLHEMDFYPWFEGQAFTTNCYGIKEPLVSKFKEIKTENSLILIPGLMFDYQGNRLGYGGGYYDRYLSTHKFKLKIGVCFEQRIRSEIPVSENDVGVDVVVTEKRVFYS